MTRIIGRPLRAGTFRIFALTALAILGGCTGTKTDEAATYQRAYDEGCDSGYTQAFGSTVRRSADKNELQYTTDANYRRGWYNGYKQCFADGTRAIETRSGGGR